MATDRVTPINVDVRMQDFKLKEPPESLAPGAQFEIRITSKSGQVDFDYIRLSKRGRQEILWHNQTDQPVVISFAKREPFEDALFVIAAGECVRSKPVIEAAIENKAYKYSVSGVDGTNDPTIIIQK